jgi:predicted MFS family arabinose efflux permease
MILAGACASLVGIGLARFAYTPLLPAIIGAHWFRPSAAAYLGAANLAGYLAGAILGRKLSTRMHRLAVLRGMMLLATVAFFACAAPLSLGWFFSWRLLSGIAGGMLMVLAAPTILPHVSPRHRGLAGGVIFAGVGVGIAASGTLVPLLLHRSLGGTWCSLGALSLLLTGLAWKGWPAADPPAARAPIADHSARARSPQLRWLHVEYGLNAVGLVPHMLFLVDYVVRGLGQSLASGAHYWVLFGLGAICGPLVGGHLADRIGFRAALRLAFLVQAAAVLLPVLVIGKPALAVSSLVVGAFTPGIVPLVLGRIHDLLPHDASAQRVAWSTATTSFALMQAAGAYALTFVLARSGYDYGLLFVTGAVAIFLALCIDLAPKNDDSSPRGMWY